MIQQGDATIACPELSIPAPVMWQESASEVQTTGDQPPLGK